MEIRTIAMSPVQVRSLTFNLNLVKEITQGLGGEHLFHQQVITTLKMVVNNGQPEIPLNETQVGLLFFYLNVLNKTLVFLTPKTPQQFKVIALQLTEIMILKDVVSTWFRDGVDKGNPMP